MSSGERPTTRLRRLIGRREPVLAVLGTPNAYHARIMEAHGAEAAFVGTSITGGNYTGLPDTGVLSATECGDSNWTQSTPAASRYTLRRSMHTSRPPPSASRA